MSMQFNRSRRSAGLAEPVTYAATAIIVLTLVSVVLEKIGVTSTILLWGAFAIVGLVMVICANSVWPTRLASYAVSGRNAPPSMIASGQIAALAPAAFASALWARGEISYTPSALTLAGIAAGLWLSALLFGAPMNRSGAYGLPQLLQARFGSVLVRILSLVLVAVPTFLLICGQVIAFGMLAEHRLGIPANGAMVASIVIVAMLVWLPGIRGALIAGAISIAALAIGFSSITWLLDAEFLQSSAPVLAEREFMQSAAESALPFLAEAGKTGSSPGEELAFAAALAASVSILPMMTQFHPMASTGSRTVNTAVSASIALAAMLVAAILIVPSGMPGVLTGALSEVSGGTVLVDLAAAALLHAMIATGAVHISGFAGLISLDGYHGIGGRQASENGRLIAARATVLLTAVAVGWVVLTWRHAAIAAAMPALLAAGAGVFPAAVAAIWWKRCSGLAAIAGMLTGAALVICSWLAGEGLIDPASLVSGPSPLLDFLLQLPLSGSALVGMGLAGAVVVALSYLPRKHREPVKPFFEAIREDRHRRLLNETVI